MDFRARAACLQGEKRKAGVPRGDDFVWSSRNGHVGAMSYQDLRFPVSDSRTPKRKPAYRQNGNDISFNICTSCFTTGALIWIQLWFNSLVWSKIQIPWTPSFGVKATPNLLVVLILLRLRSYPSARLSRVFSSLAQMLENFEFYQLVTVSQTSKQWDRWVGLPHCPSLSPNFRPYFVGQGPLSMETPTSFPCTSSVTRPLTRLSQWDMHLGLIVCHVFFPWSLAIHWSPKVLRNPWRPTWPRYGRGKRWCASGFRSSVRRCQR